jgi:hypothetical protein
MGEPVYRCEGCRYEGEPRSCPQNTTFCLRDLEQQIQKVRELRAEYESKTQELHERQVEFNQQHANLIEAKCGAASDCAQEEARLREMTLAAYRATGNKKPAPGVSIRIVKVCEFEPVEAKKWAVSIGACLKLDEAAYKAALTKGIFDGMPGTVNEVPQATIAREL